MSANISFRVELDGPTIIMNDVQEVRFSVTSALRLEYRLATESEIQSSIYSDDPADPENIRRTLVVIVANTRYTYAALPTPQAQAAYETLVKYVR